VATEEGLPVDLPAAHQEEETTVPLEAPHGKALGDLSKTFHQEAMASTVDARPLLMRTNMTMVLCVADLQALALLPTVVPSLGGDPLLEVVVVANLSLLVLPEVAVMNMIPTWRLSTMVVAVVVVHHPFLLKEDLVAVVVVAAAPEIL